MRAVTGWDDFDVDELMEIGERRLNMLRAFNAREGIGRDARTGCRRSSSGRSAARARRRAWPSTTAEIEGALDEYYRLAGWDGRTGNPTPDTLARLGLEWAV